MADTYYYLNLLLLFKRNISLSGAKTTTADSHLDDGTLSGLCSIRY